MLLADQAGEKVAQAAHKQQDRADGDRDPQPRTGKDQDEHARGDEEYGEQHAVPASVATFPSRAFSSLQHLDNAGNDQADAQGEEQQAHRGERPHGEDDTEDRTERPGDRFYPASQSRPPAKSHPPGAGEALSRTRETQMTTVPIERIATAIPTTYTATSP